VQLDHLVGSDVFVRQEIENFLRTLRHSTVRGENECHWNQIRWQTNILQLFTNMFYSLLSIVQAGVAVGITQVLLQY
jgi:hypothetical protein